jgi:hypothetical protein
LNLSAIIFACPRTARRTTYSTGFLRNVSGLTVAKITARTLPKGSEPPRTRAKPEKAEKS